jgi:hypothetical protein
VAIVWYCRTFNANWEVEFRGAIASAIPSISTLLEVMDQEVRWKTVELIGNLAHDGERKLDSIAA